MAEEASISALMDRVARTAPFHRELAKLGTEEQAVFDHTSLPGVPFVAALCIRTLPDTARAWVVAPHLRAQEALAAQLETWGVRHLLFIPEKEVALGEEMGDPELAAERLNILHRISSSRTGGQTIILTEGSLNDEVPSPDGMQNQGITLKTGETHAPDDLIRQFGEAGFEGVPQVISRGQWSRRGGILDVFPLQSSHPVRLEFFDDEIESIREFDVDSQISFRKAEHVNLILTEAEGAETLRDWIKPGDLVITAPFCKERGNVCILTSPPENAAGEEDFSLAIHDNPLGSFEAGDFVMQEMRHELAERQIREWLDRKWNVSMFFPNEGEEERFRDICAGTPALLSITPLRGELPAGFSIPEAKTAVLSSSELFGRYQSATARRRASREDKARKARAQASLKDVNPGDLVVHTSYGIGKFINISASPDSGDEEMNILYRDNTILHVPLSQAHLVSRYIGLGSKTPELNKLGDSKWQRAKKSAERSVADYAAQLLNVQAERQTGKGYSHPPDSKWMWEFESSFPFRETQDQLRAIAQTKADMESTRPMDRLICGDVGFGKTEVAIRAAFKAVQEDKQVVYLVPTTILAQQHYNTFVQRMKEFPVKVELLCRFRTSAQQKKTIEGIKKGQVDIVIGTHRVLSKDVEFKNLGLLIIDEEQRFGVTHKEKIKQMKKDVDVLTLTATPIPRTLHMSLIGIRDMSVLEEPPMDRVPIQTYVMEYDEETVREAIRRELRRGGQVYYVYNRVNDIAEVALRISRLVPEARVDFAHGQMSQRELEQVMYDFINGDVDVLVSTTIIETGLDISNVNTMIIHDSDRYGLSQLYQLRGRVGRSNRTAYAFLMYTKNKMLQETAEKRLSAMREYSDLGSGFKIAMKDLELRGAGNLLGAQQHGHMNAVGYDLYCKMLSEAVKEAKGIRTMDDFETTIDLNIDAFIPDSYIGNEFQKLDIYKRIAGIESQQEYDDMLEELIDRFGEPTKAVLNLLAIARLKALAHQGYVTEIKQLGKDVRITLYEKAKLDPAGIPAIMAQYRRGLQFKADHEPKFILTPQGRLIEELMKFAGELAKLAEPLE